MILSELNKIYEIPLGTIIKFICRQLNRICIHRRSTASRKLKQSLIVFKLTTVRLTDPPTVTSTKPYKRLIPKNSLENSSPSRLSKPNSSPQSAIKSTPAVKPTSTCTSPLPKFENPDTPPLLNRQGSRSSVNQTPVRPRMVTTLQ